MPTKKKCKKHTCRCIRYTFFFLLFLSFLLSLLLFSPPGRRFTTQQILKQLPQSIGTLTSGTLTGIFPFDFVLPDISFHRDGLNITVDDARFSTYVTKLIQTCSSGTLLKAKVFGVHVQPLNLDLDRAHLETECLPHQYHLALLIPKYSVHMDLFLQKETMGMETLKVISPMLSLVVNKGQFHGLFEKQSFEGVVSPFLLKTMGQTIWMKKNILHIGSTISFRLTPQPNGAITLTNLQALQSKKRTLLTPIDSIYASKEGVNIKMGWYPLRIKVQDTTLLIKHGPVEGSFDLQYPHKLQLSTRGGSLGPLHCIHFNGTLDSFDKIFLKDFYATTNTNEQLQGDGIYYIDKKQFDIKASLHFN